MDPLPLRDSAPGLTADKIDGLLRDAYVEGYWRGRNESSKEQSADVTAAFQEGRRNGHAEGLHEARAAIERVVRGNLNHVVSGLTDIARRRGKTTIAAERDWMATKGSDVKRAIDALNQIGKGPA